MDRTIPKGRKHSEYSYEKLFSIIIGPCECVYREQNEENVEFLEQASPWEDQPESSLGKLVPLSKEQNLLSDRMYLSTPVESLISFLTKEKGAIQ